jgi:hypothetical protein
MAKILELKEEEDSSKIMMMMMMKTLRIAIDLIVL